MEEPLNRWSSTEDRAQLYLNATAVALEGRAALILGASGSGKSSLALALMSLGAALIADDGIWVVVEQGAIIVERPAQAPALIEARGIGLLRSGPVVPRARLSLAIDLDHGEESRLPPRRMVAMEGARAPLIRGARQPNLAMSVLQILRHGRAEV